MRHARTRAASDTCSSDSAAIPPESASGRRDAQTSVLDPLWCFRSRCLLSWNVMALSNAERQRQWRKRHPEKADKRFDAFKEWKAVEAAQKAAGQCEHEGGLVELDSWFCCKCRNVLHITEHLDGVQRAIAEGKRDDVNIVYQFFPRCSPFARRR